jgi:ABC-type glutathione transport system ATPase component
MRAERAARRDRTGTAKMTAQEADRSGFKVIECKQAGYRYAEDGRWIVRDLDVRIERGDKIGIVGPNGAGKTTLLRLLLGQLAPKVGTIEQGTRLEVVYFDQLRAQLDETMRVQDAVADGNPTVTINGRTRHVISYLEDFLFEPARARTPIRALSGRAQPAAARAAVHEAVQRPRARRADQRPRCGNARAARRPPGGVRRHPAAGQPRPRLPQRGVHEPPRLRGRGEDFRVRRRL